MPTGTRHLGQGQGLELIVSAQYLLLLPKGMGADQLLVQRPERVVDGELDQQQRCAAVARGPWRWQLAWPLGFLCEC
jgi:hypothetical protein